MSHRAHLLAVCLIAPFIIGSCEGMPPGGVEAVENEQQAAGPPYEIDFNPHPPYLDKNVVILTFDDGPDGQYTAKVLDVLKEKDVKATFFFNGHNNSNLDTDTGAQNLVKRALAEGHQLASHTDHHIDLAVSTPEKIEQEIVVVENQMKKILGDSGPKMTLIRTPYGRPYQSEYGSANYKKVSAVLSKHGVHVGWNFDSNDWMYQGNANMVYSSVTGLIKTPGTGAWGVVLMHSINPQTAGALPRIIDYMKTNGFVFKLVEDAVRGKYGKSSAELLGVASGGGSGGSSGSTGGSGGGTGGATGTGGAPEADAGTPADASSGSTGGSGGSMVAVDAGKPSPGTGGKPGTGGSTGTTGTGGSAEEPDPDPPSTKGGKSGGCSYGSAPQGGALIFALLALVGLLRRARR